MGDKRMRTDEQIWTAIGEEVSRQERQLELIASENHASPEVIAAMGTAEVIAGAGHRARSATTAAK